MAEHPSPQASAPPRSERAARTRQRILDAAGQRFADRGFAKTTVEEIAAEAGVSKGIVYHHFGGKEALLESLIERLTSEWIEVSGLGSWLARTGDLERALAGMLRGSLEYARGNPLVRGLLQLDPTVMRGLERGRLRKMVAEERARMVDELSQGVARGDLRNDLDVEKMADVIRMLDMALIGHLLDPDWLDSSDEGFVETCIEVLFHGIAGGGR